MATTGGGSVAPRPTGFVGAARIQDGLGSVVLRRVRAAGMREEPLGPRQRMRRKGLHEWMEIRGVRPIGSNGTWDPIGWLTRRPISCLDRPTYSEQRPTIYYLVLDNILVGKIYNIRGRLPFL